MVGMHFSFRFGCARSARRWLLAVGVTFGLIPCATAADTPAGERPLSMGILPYLSTQQLFEKFAPMKQYLERELDRRIEMTTAPNYRVYVQRAARGEYDIYETAPHFALLAEVEHGYRRASRIARELDGSVVVRRDGPIKRVGDLRGGVVATPDPLAVITFLGEELLQQHGLTPGRDVRLLRSPSHNNAMMRVIHGDATAAVSSSADFEKLAPTLQAQLRLLTKTRQIPHMMIMAGPRLAPAEQERLRHALVRFTRAGPGARFFDITGLGDMAPIRDTDMARLKPFLQPLKERMQ